MKADAVATMAEDAAEFHRRGWMLGTCGNMSVRLGHDPLEMLVSASGIHKSRLGPDDFLRVGAGVTLLEPSRHRPSSEVTVHEVIYRRTPARAVYHVHTVWNNLASQLAGGPIVLRGVEMVKGLAGFALADTLEIPVVENSQDMQELARNVDAGLNPRCPAVAVRLHGVYSWGADLDEARRHVEVLEFLLEYYCRAKALSA
ncbi:MAG: methylthioribulose 1-phosphate dehydratase [Candidatus Eremiobacterota bacterium]